MEVVAGGGAEAFGIEGERGEHGGLRGMAGEHFGFNAAGGLVEGQDGFGVTGLGDEHPAGYPSAGGMVGSELAQHDRPGALPCR